MPATPTSSAKRWTERRARAEEGALSDLAPLAIPAWHAFGVVAAGGSVLVIWLRLRPRPVYALGLSLAAVAALGPAIRPWYALWGLVLTNKEVAR